MALFEKGNKIGNRFTSENQPKNSGRKPALYTQLKKLTGKQVKHELSKEDYYKIIQYLMERTPNELKTIIDDAKKQNGTTPVWVINIISAIQNDIRYGRTNTIDSVFDRIFGKATQPIDAEVTTRDTQEALTEEQIRAELEKIDNALK